MRPSRNSPNVSGDRDSSLRRSSVQSSARSSARSSACSSRDGSHRIEALFSPSVSGDSAGPNDAPEMNPVLLMRAKQQEEKAERQRQLERAKNIQRGGLARLMAFETTMEEDKEERSPEARMEDYLQKRPDVAPGTNQATSAQAVKLLSDVSQRRVSHLSARRSLP